MAQLVHQGLCLQVVESKGLLYLVPMLFGKLVEIIGDDSLHQFLDFRLFTTVYLQQQAFPQVAGPDTGRVQLL